MKYLLLVCWDAERQNSQPEPERSPADEVDEGFPWLNELRARGAWILGDQLVAPKRARSVRKRAGKVNVTDGPFIETKEAIGGYFILKARDYGEAVELASDCPHLQYGRIDEILATGLHAYLTQFLERVNALGTGISRDFLVPVA